MNRKFINAFFAAALLLGGATVFSSCKDTNEDMRTELEADIAKNKAEQAKLQAKLNELEGRIPENLKDNIDKLLKLEGLSEGLLKAIDQQISALEERANVSVTSVVLQSVENPVFGSVSLPIDMKTNMLLTYYGGFDEMDFPSTKNANNIGDVLDTDEVASTEKVGGDVTSITKDAEGKVVENYVGTVYTTINPSSVDATSEDIKWALVNSQDKNYGGIELQNVKLSDKVLEFGIGSRAGNGFYEATAVANKLDEIKYDIVDGLAEDVKDALTNHSKQDAKDLIQLVIAQLRKNDFPALGVKAAYSWNDVTFTPKLDGQQWVLDGNVTETPQNAAAYSEYAIAAAAIKPLSFNFLAGQSLDKLPTIPDLGEFDINDYFTFEVKGTQIKPIEVSVTISDNSIKVTIPRSDIYDSTGKVIGYLKETTVENVDVDALTGSIESALDEAMDNATTEIQNAIDEMVKNINKQLEDNFQKVNDKIASATDRVQPWIDRANRVINKVNSLLKNPNHYLQVCALYENGDKIGRMSNTSAVPTYFPGGGASTLNVILTTYNLETICPAYMKYYAVYKDGASDPVAYDIIPGTQSRVAISGLEDGAKYKVVYQALDYHGVTSTQKFYFQIGE